MGNKKNRPNAAPNPPSRPTVNPPPLPGNAQQPIQDGPAPLATSSLVERLSELLRQFVDVTGRLGEELSPGRITTAVERQLGVTPSVIHDAVGAHRELRQSLADLSSKMARVDQQVSELGNRATSEQVRAAIDKALAPELGRVKEQFERLTRDLEGLAQRVSSGQVQQDVQDAASALTQQYRAELQVSLSRLQQTFENLDQHAEQLKIYVDTFGPGGLPVLKQRCDELQVQLEAERQAYAATRKTLQEREQKLLDTERELYGLRAGQGSIVSLDELERRRKELEEREKQVSAQEALRAENTRLRKDLGDLRSELAEHERELEAAQLTAQERAELDRLRHQLDEADRSSQRQERQRIQKEQELRRLREECRGYEEKLRALVGAEALAAKRELRIQTLEAENRSLHDLCEDLRTQAAKDRTDRQHAVQRIQSLERELQAQLAREDHLESVWRQQRQAQWTQEARELHEKEHKWAEDRAAALSLQAERALKEAQAEIARLRAAQAALNDTLTVQQSDCQRLRGELAHVQVLLSEEKGRTAAEQVSLAAAQERQEKHITRCEIEAKARIDQYQQDSLNRIEQEQTRARQEVAEATERAGEQRRELAELSARCATLKAQVEQLEQQRQDLRDKILPREERLRPLQAKVFAAEELAKVAEQPSETEWLSGIERDLEQAGFAFHPRLVRAFHTSLKISKLAPLTVLAGISGTGKSELPRLYADLGGLSFLPIPVQPSWDSPQDLFGFFNYTEGRYKAEPLARLLYQIKQGSDTLGQGLTLVLLDEMNLARVEYYFAELLSRLEARRSVDPERAVTRRRASVQLDIGAGEDPEELFLDERILFVGTMNEDESTLSLSAKVLDRSCVLSFPRPRDMRVREHIAELPPCDRLPAETWRGWCREPQDDENSSKLNDISETMDLLDRSFGHRLFRAIHAYVANYPAGADAELTRTAAWEDQWSMKILPRLKGLECDDKKIRRGLDALAALVPEKLRPAFKRARERDYFDWGGCPELFQAETAEPRSA